MAKAPSGAAPSVSFQDFAEVTLASIDKTIARAADPRHPLFRNPIITIGIIWRPDWNLPEFNQNLPGR